MSELLVGLGGWLCVALAWGYIDRDRRHQNCRWWSRWLKRPCYACIHGMERECGIPFDPTARETSRR